MFSMKKLISIAIVLLSFNAFASKSASELSCHINVNGIQAIPGGDFEHDFNFKFTHVDSEYTQQKYSTFFTFQGPNTYLIEAVINRDANNNYNLVINTLEKFYDDIRTSSEFMIPTEGKNRTMKAIKKIDSYLDVTNYLNLVVECSL